MGDNNFSRRRCCSRDGAGRPLSPNVFDLDSLGAEPTALAVEQCAKDLEEWARTRDLEALTLAEATTESGLSYSAIQRAVREGRIPNAGTPGHPRIRRADIPKKTPGRTQREGTPDLLAIIASGRPRRVHGA